MDKLLEEKRTAKEIDNADRYLHEGTGYVVHLYLSLLEEIKEQLYNFDPKKPVLFIENIGQLLYEHTSRPRQYGGEFPLPKTLFSPIQYKKINEKTKLAWEYMEHLEKANHL